MDMTTHRVDEIELDEDVQEGLRRLAERSSRSPSELANAALRELVSYEERLHESIARGLADIEAGRVMDTDELRQRLAERRRRRAAR